MQRAWILTLVILAYAPRARGDDALPTLTFQADPSGKGAKLKAGFDLRRGLPISMVISPFFEGSTDNGAANLFSLNSKGISASNNWNLGVIASFFHWGDLGATDREAAGSDDVYQTLLAISSQACASECEDKLHDELAVIHFDDKDQIRMQCTFNYKADPTRGFCEARHELRKGIICGAIKRDPSGDEPFTAFLRDAKKAGSPPQEGQPPQTADRAKQLLAQLNSTLDQIATRGISYENVCKTQMPALRNYLRSHYDGWSSIPRRVLQVGASAGATVSNYLAPGAGGELTLRNPTHWSETIGGMAIKTFPRWRVALEVPTVVKREFKLERTDTAKWCVPAGQVIGDGGMRSDAETCDEKPLGPLRRHYTINAAAIASLLSPSSFWRIGLGPALSFSPKADGQISSSYRIGAVMPLYIGTNLLKKDLKGLARLSIGAFASRGGDGKTERTLTINVAILATTTLFPSVFDQF